ncbi:Nucleosomal histone H3-Lys79 methylase [Puccinia graminis f. sp. tritici]|uniref:Histone-lysine N-methyltransferase, H3 lysine-79 specific n=1 Tax=Puccinia graminis f. sp. tritici TaxID=56615 RepID=A0A5B0RJJ5_PUCGR|nr:Nucleosomal histone H3-Lys79 methylase [Puccinia graminis f. sp. tritici]
MRHFVENPTEMGGSLREVPPARRGPPVPLERGDCAKLVFTPSLNESLSLLFLELKDTAQIVSLKPFISSSFKLNQHNLDSPLAILSRPALRPTPPSTLVANSPGVFSYPSNSVSWTDNPGDFFVSVVNRSNYNEKACGLGR